MHFPCHLTSASALPSKLETVSYDLVTCGFIFKGYYKNILQTFVQNLSNNPADKPNVAET